MEKSVMDSFTEEERVELLEIVSLALYDQRMADKISDHLDLGNYYLMKLKSRAESKISKHV